MADPRVAIVGAGPTGLMLSAELKLAGVEAVILERRTEAERVQPGALGLHARTLELFDQRGIVERFLAEGTIAQVAGFAGMRLDLSDFPTRHPYGLALVQKRTERILRQWVYELGVEIRSGADLVRFEQHADEVELVLRDGTVLRTSYLVGCDGGRSFVRKAAGIGFPGVDASVSHLLAEADMAETPPLGMRTDAIGTHALSRTETGRVSIMVTEAEIGRSEPTLEVLRAALLDHYGSDFGVHDPSYITRFTDMTRQAASYRLGRVLLAGDAAHIHYPAGGFGMGIGIEDAVNLGWKLAEVVAGRAGEALLDTYHAERHPVAKRLLRYTMATRALARTDARSMALAEIVREMVDQPGGRALTAGHMSGLAIHYDLGAGHPLVGRRMPDLDLEATDGPRRVYALLHAARPLLIDLADTGVAAGPWRDRVVTIRAHFDGDWVLPVFGPVAAPTAVLVRPDGHVGWVGAGSDDGLVAALTRWFGPRLA
jgi:3-(3-hydroxy-phenyl)propionate hydroxylase